MEEKRREGKVRRKEEFERKAKKEKEIEREMGRYKRRKGEV